MPENLPEESFSFALSLRLFEVKDYQLLDPNRPAVGYNWTATFTVSQETITVGLTCLALGTEGKLEDQLAKCITETAIHILGLGTLHHPTPDSIVVPDPIMANVVNIAIGASRGAMAVLSNGKFQFPLLDATSLIPKENKPAIEPA